MTKTSEELLKAVHNAVADAVTSGDLPLIEALFTHLRMASTMAGLADARLRGVPIDRDTRSAYLDICAHAWDTCLTLTGAGVAVKAGQA